MAAYAAEADELIAASLQSFAPRERAAACLYLNTAIAAVPALAAAWEARRQEMTTAGASDDEVLEALLGLARPYMGQADGMSEPGSMEDAVAMIEGF